MKCSFTKKTDKFKCFHIIGIDILPDEEGNCWLLEINANPSLNVEFDPDDWKAGSKGYKKDQVRESVLSPVDVYVKTQ